MHLWTAYPSGGGFDERTPLICLHHSGGSGRFFAPMLRELGQDRSLYAPDLPGHGSSDVATARAGVAELAGAVGDFIDSLRLRQVDVFGYQLGAQIAAEVAIARPQQVRRIMVWGLPSYTTQERSAIAQQIGAPGVRDDGADVVEEWRRALERRGPGVGVSTIAEDFGDRLRAGAHGSRAYAAALDYAPAERLPLVKQPTLVLRLRDEYWEHAPRVRTALSNGSMLDLPDHGQGFISAAPQRFASVAREFLDR